MKKLKKRERDELMSLQREISYEHTQQLVGKTIKVMVEGYLFEDDIYVGRSYMDAPKVDGCVFINSPEELMTGDFVYVKITQGREYDVIGEVDYEFTKWVNNFKNTYDSVFLFFLLTDYAGNCLANGSQLLYLF